MFSWILRTGLYNNQVGLIGSFSSNPSDADAETLMFLPNPKYKNFITPFQNNLVRNYRAEYNLEITRQRYFPKHPSRLNAIFLLWTKENAEKYQTRHPEHVADRILKKVKTNGDYKSYRLTASGIPWHVLSSDWCADDERDNGLIPLDERPI